MTRSSSWPGCASTSASGPCSTSPRARPGRPYWARPRPPFRRSTALWPRRCWRTRPSAACCSRAATRTARPGAGGGGPRAPVPARRRAARGRARRPGAAPLGRRGLETLSAAVGIARRRRATRRRASPSGRTPPSWRRG
jgi:hypothetical protein